MWIVIMMLWWNKLMCNHCCKVNCALLCIDNVFFFLLQNSLEKNKMKNLKEESPRKKSGNKSISNHFFKKKREVIEKQYRHSISTWQFQTIGYIYFVWHTNPHWSFDHISYNSFENGWCIAKKKIVNIVPNISFWNRNKKKSDRLKCVCNIQTKKQKHQLDF